MLIVMDATAAPEDVRRVVETVVRLGLQAHPIPGAQRTAIGITGNKGTVEPGVFENLPGVLRGHPGLGAVQARLAGGQAGEHGRLRRRRR